MESYTSAQHDAGSGRLAGSSERRAGQPAGGSSLAGGLAALVGLAPAMVAPGDYFAEVSRARNRALSEAGQSSRMPRSECNDGIPNMLQRMDNVGMAPVYFTPTDRSMVLYCFEHHGLVKKPRVRGWLVLLGDRYLADSLGRRRWFGSSAAALKAANKAEASNA